jgi:hypothetical protein
MIYSGEKLFFMKYCESCCCCEDWYSDIMFHKLIMKGLRYNCYFHKCNETTYIGFKGSTLVHNDTILNCGMLYDEFSNHKMFVVKTFADYDNNFVNYLFEDILPKKFHMCFDRDYKHVLCGQVDSTRNELVGLLNYIL